MPTKWNSVLDKEGVKGSSGTAVLETAMSLRYWEYDR